MPFIEYGGKRILFIHIPKTGGQSVERWLSEHGKLRFHNAGTPLSARCTPQHFRWTDLRELFGADYFDYVFTIVRNPYERIESEYRMTWILGMQGFFRAAPGFAAWLDSTLESFGKTAFFRDNHFRPQSEFIGKAVRVFRFEEGIGPILDQVAHDTGLPPPVRVAHDNASSDFAGQIDWDIPQLDQVARLYADDLRRFGYDPAGRGL